MVIYRTLVWVRVSARTRRYHDLPSRSTIGLGRAARGRGRRGDLWRASRSPWPGGGRPPPDGGRARGVARPGRGADRRGAAARRAAPRRPGAARRHGRAAARRDGARGQPGDAHRGRRAGRSRDAAGPRPRRPLALLVPSAGDDREGHRELRGAGRRPRAAARGAAPAGWPHRDLDPGEADAARARPRRARRGADPRDRRRRKAGGGRAAAVREHRHARPRHGESAPANTPRPTSRRARSSRRWRSSWP